MKYYKITNEEELHHGLQYKTGLVEDILPFRPEGACKPGGIYFAREDILAFIYMGSWVREVTIPEDAQVYEEPGNPKKWKADKLVLGERRRITVEVLEELIKEGADIHAYDDEALCWAANKGHADVVRLLIEHGANVRACDDQALRWSAWHDHLEVVELLLEHSANVHAEDDQALRGAAIKGHLEVVKLLIEHGAYIHAWNDEALRYASENGHLEVVKVLKEAMKKQNN